MASVSNSTPFALSAGSGETTWNKISAGGTSTYGITSENYLFAWGLGTSGQLGDGTAISKSSPVQIGVTYNESTLFEYAQASGITLNSWTQVVSATSTMAGITSDGSLFTWGAGTNGELGINNNSKVLSYPTKIGTSSWASVNAGATHFAAIRSDGRLFAWGNNSSGQLGLDDLVHRSSPVQIGTGSWTSVSAGASNTSAIDSTYKLWTWGNNTNGQLGIGDIFARSSPVIVGSINDSGYYSNYFDGTGDYLSLTSPVVAATGDFTIEGWFNLTSAIGTRKDIFYQANPSTGVDGRLIICVTVSGTLEAFVGGTGAPGAILSSTVFSPNTWYHFAYVRSSDTFSLYINGVLEGTQPTSTISIVQQPLLIGYNPLQVPVTYWQGYLSNMRVVNGTALYTTNFTPPSAPLTAISGTSLLTCQNSIFIDNSTNNFTITASGNTVPSTIIPLPSPSYAYAGPSWTQVSTGNSVTAAVTSNGNLFTWGAAAAGQVGQGILVHRSSPVQISTFAGTESVIDSYVTNVGYSGPVYYSWTSVASVASFTMAVRSDGMLFGWGNNNQGQLGTNDTISVSIPTMIGTSSWTSVYASGRSTVEFTMAIRSDGALFTWGGNLSGNLATNDSAHRSSPVQIGTDSWVQASAGDNWVLARRNDGSIFSWGFNGPGRLGDNTTIARSSPVQIGTSSWTHVDAGGVGAAVAIRTDGGLFTWGDNSLGELGSNSRVHRSSPVQLGTSSWTFASSGYGQILAIRSDGGLFSWGTGDSGRLGSNTTASRSSPVQVGTSSWSTVATGDQSSYGILITGALFTWGLGTSGQLGSNALVSRSSPVQVGTSSWTTVSTGKNGGPTVSTAAAIRSDGRLFMWGINNSSQLGSSLLTARSSPVVVTPYTDSFSSVSVGGSHIAVIRADNTLWSWGLNTSGQLGDGTILSRSAPVQVGNSFWNAVNAGGTHAVALNTNNNLFAWGLNTSGQVGDATLVARSSPVQLGSSVYTEIDASINSSYAKKNNYIVYGWGANSQQFGSLGLRGNQSSPVVVASIADKWNAISGAEPGTFTYGVRSDKKLFTWGTNANGQLGQNDVLTRSNPTQLGSGIPIGYYSNYFDGTGYLSVPDNAAWSFGSGNFTIEAWLFSTTTYSGRIYTQYQSSTNQIAIQLGSNQVRFFQYTGGSFNPDITTSTTLTLGQWNHVAVVRNGNVFTIYINGVASATQTSAITLTDFAAPITISTYNGTAEFYTGYISNYRIVKGIAVYTSNFTPPTSPLTAISGTVLLTCNNSSFSDSSVNNFSITGTGNVSVQTNYPSSFSAPAGGASSKLWSSVTTGSLFGAALTETNELFTWGDNASGQLGIEVGIVPAGSWIVPRSSPVQVGTVTFAASPMQVGTSSWTMVSSGTKHVLATRTDGSLFAWGLNSSYQLGDNTQVHRSSPVQIGSSSWTQVSAGDSHSLAIANDSTLYGWGATGYESSTAPYTLPFFQTYGDYYLSIAGGANYMLAIKNDGSLWSWGQNDFGALGLGDVIHRSSPVQIGTSSWSQIGVTNSTAYAIRSDGSLFAWGQNANGFVGDNTLNSRSSPVQIGTASWILIGGAGAAIQSDYSLWVWGSNSNGQLGLGDTVARSSPVKLGTSSWLTVSATNELIKVAIRQDGLLFAWGAPSSGASGLSDSILRSSPTQVGTSSWTAVSLNGMFTYAIRTDGKLFTWGLNTHGQLGTNDIVHRSSPVQIGTSNWTKVSAGNPGPAGSAPGFGFAIRSDGSLFAIGNNSTGQLGLNNAVSVSSPVLVGTSSWTQVAAGSTMTGALLSGRLFTWGSNTPGQLGSNSTISRSSPVQVGSQGGIPVFGSQPIQISSSSWTQVSAGYSHSLAIKNDSTLWGWGNPAVKEFTTYSWIQTSASLSTALIIRQDGALFAWGAATGDGTVVTKSSPVQIGSSSWTQITAGVSASLAVRADGALFGWGNNGGNLGDNTIIPRSSPVQIGTSSWTLVNTEGGVSTAIRADGSLWVWGSLTNGQEGKGVTGTAAVRSSPVQTGTNVGTSWKDANITGLSTFALRDDGLLYGWGFANTLGDNGGATNANPILITSLNTEADYIDYLTNNSIPTYSWTSISAGGNHSVAVRSDGSLFTWGANNNGTTGDDSTYTKNYPTKIGTSSWISASAGSSHVAALRSDGAVFAWGLNTLGQVGDGTTTNRSSPVQIGTSSWTQVVAGGASTYAIAPDGGLFAWGFNGQGQLGDGTVTNRSSPVKIGTDSWAQLGAGQSYAIGINNVGILYAWGSNTGGLLGDGTSTNRASPVQVTSLNTPEIEASYGSANNITTYSWSQISSNVSHIVAIRSDKLLFAWGLNNSGQLGDDTRTGKSSPIQIGTSSWTTVATGLSFSAAIRSDGTLWTWGVNNNGMLGLNDTVARSSPVQVGTLNTWKSLSIQGYNSSHLLATNNSDILYAWGLNSTGQLGDGTVIAKSSPVQVGTSLWSTVSAGTGYTLAVRNDGALFTFGAGTNGVLGSNASINRSSPVQVGTSSWSQVSAGLSYSFALRSDGSLFSWGGNSGGQLGDNTRLDRSSPVQIGTSSWVSIASGGGYGQFAIRLDGALFAWGNNTNGGLGVGDTITRSSPVQVGSSSWSAIGCGNTNSSVGLTLDRSLFTWGFNTAGLLGTIKGYSSTSSPVFVNTINDSWSSVGIGAHAVFTGAIRNDSKLFMWGLNSAGQLGTNDIIHRSNPVQIGNSNWTSVRYGISHTVAKSGDSVFAWGGNSVGQLGQNDVVPRSSPVQVGTMSWTSIAAGGGVTIGLRTDNILFGFGSKTEMGETKTLPATYSSPVVIRTTLDTWDQIAVGISPGAGAAQHVMGIRSDKKLFAWGANNGGQLGHDDLISKSNPIQVGNSSWVHVAANASSTSAIRSDGALFVWGLGTSGQLGFDDIISRSSPVQVGSLSWTAIAQGPSFSKFAIRQDGVLFAAGTGINGEPTRSSPVQVGTPYGYIVNPTNYSTLTQVGNSSWTQVSAGNNYSMGIRASDNVLFAWGFNQFRLLNGSIQNMGYSAAQVSSGNSHFGFIKKS